MKYITEFRDAALARHVSARIHAEADPARSYAFMEFCGGHTHAVSRYGVTELLPRNVRMIHGPGCPVCVLPIGRIDLAIQLALEHGAIVCTYGDTMRIPASRGLSLWKAKARGGDIRMLYSVEDALAIARANPSREVVFFAIGFETTTPPTALTVLAAEREQLRNFSVLCCHVLTPPAIVHLLAAAGTAAGDSVRIDGFIGPAHVSIIIGTAPYEPFAAAYRKPVVIAGFEPLDVIQAIALLVRQVNQDRAEVENEFVRAVQREGNLAAQRVMAQVFCLRESFEWRGLGEVPWSALKLRVEYAAFDAERRFSLDYRQVADHKQCECSAILRGVRRPTDCKLFARACTPDNPLGACMVSSEGACAAHYSYGRFRDGPARS
jgi:hydrogenase expression/formation protein HypD